MRTEQLDFELPDELIASLPPQERDGGRLLRVDRRTGAIAHQRVRDLTELIPRDALVVLNDTRVIKARLRGQKSTGGQAEFLLVRAIDDASTRWRALARASRAMREGTEVRVDDSLVVRVAGRDEEGLYLVELLTDDPLRAIERCGELPIPPYMRRRAGALDEQRYQTVFAARPGAVAAPTAGLHLTEATLKSLRDKGVRVEFVTLHVGLGTFQPVVVDDLDAHPMHAEWYELSRAVADSIHDAKKHSRPVFAVGTTVVRALESWALDGPLSGDTRLLIQPGYAFRVVDALLTNFHLPRSTLLALVMAFGGIDLVRSAYADAVAQRYRFFSYGDAMLLS